jgi:hypothetical protein
VELGDLGDARVARRTMHLGDLRIQPERTAEGVLTPSGTNDEYAHPTILAAARPCTDPGPSGGRGVRRCRKGSGFFGNLHGLRVRPNE